MRSSQKRQYTVRNLTDQLDAKIREQTQATGKSLNEVVLDALKRGVGLDEGSIEHRDLDHLIGSWKDDPKFDKALRLQDGIDPRLWK